MRIDKAKIHHLRLNDEKIVVDDGHACTDCSYTIDEKESETFDPLPDLEASLPSNVIENLVYVAGYLTRKEYPTEDTYHYYEQYGDYTRKLNLGAA